MSGKKDQKYTLRQFSWNGFNLTVGILFLGSLALLSNPTTAGGDGLGLNIIWIFLIMGIVACICAFAFTQLSRFHKSDNNGGAYIYARSVFGRFVGFVIVVLNYIIMPLVMSYQILNIMRTNLDPDMSAGGDISQWWCGWTTHLGNWSYLCFDFMGLALTVFFALVAFFGTRLYKKVSKYSLIVKWVSSGTLVLFGIIAAILPWNHGNAAAWAQNSSVTPSTFLSAFCACFYYFTGFESFATAGATVQQPEKNIGRGVMIVMFAAVLFYLAIIVIFMLALNPNDGGFVQNIATGFWMRLSEHSGWKWVIYFGPIVMLFCVIAMRGNTVAQTALYGGAVLQPMSIEGYISDKFKEQNEEGFPIKAMKAHIIIASLTIAIWLIIPDFIVGFVGKGAEFMNINTLLSAADAFYILIYVIILVCAFKLISKGLIKSNWFLTVLYAIAFAILFIVFGYHFYELFNNAFISSDDHLKNLVALIVELAFDAIVIGFILIIYFGYYKHKYWKRFAKDKNIQKKLNDEFVLLDGWDYLSGKINIKAHEFIIKQIELVNKNYFDLHNKKFLDKYYGNVRKYKERINDELTSYIKRSEKIEQYNWKNGIDTRKTTFEHNRYVVAFASKIEHYVKQPPAHFLFFDPKKNIVKG